MRIPDLDEIWTWLGGLARMGDLADVGKGLSYKAKEKLPRGVQTISDGPFKGAVRGFARFERNLCTHSLPAEKWMNLDPSVIRDAGTGTKTGCPQILLNYARVSRGPWRLKALIDRDGHAVTSNFISIRPKSASWPLEFVWAVCNSPLANAYIYAYTMKRHVLVHFVRSMPIPNVSDVSIERISTAARSYIRAVTESPSPLSSGINEVTARDSLMRLDAEVLRLYGLPPRLERQLLDLFAGWPRSGVPFVFERYFPEDFEPCFHLYDYLSEEYRASTAEKLRERHKDVTSPTLLAALKEAVDAFKE
jgi:hypothetical protein